MKRSKDHGTAAANRAVKCRAANAVELVWLSDLRESRQPLSELSPIWVRHGSILSGPALPHPEWHSYCEFSILLEGKGIAFVEDEQAERMAGDVFVVGPGVPHWGRITKYPSTFIAIYFLPSVMIDLGPQSGGLTMLRRFTSPQSLKNRLLRVPTALRRNLTRLFHAAVAEFESDWFGREIKLRAILAEQLVELLRWEGRTGRKIVEAAVEVDWSRINKALGYVHENYNEAVYGQNVARAAGVSESKMHILFHNALGMSWVKYLQVYRVHRAAALLSEPRFTVTEAALATGFESLSHFNEVFRSCMGASPKEYRTQRFPKASIS